MAPLGLMLRDRSNGRRSAGPVPVRHELTDPSSLSRSSNRAEAQEVIREGIRKGIIRVYPIAGCPTHVRVVRIQPLSGARSSGSRLDA